MRNNFRRTKIVATLGPASSSPSVMTQLIDAGVDVFRLNFSHGNYEEKRDQIMAIRDISSRSGKRVAILQDLQGPKIRVGPLADGEVMLTKGEQVKIYGDERVGVDGFISVSYPQLAHDMKPGNLVFIDDGLIELQTIDISGDAVIAEVIVGGHVRARQGVNLPGVILNTPCLTPKDEEDLAFGLTVGVDIVALSFVRKPQDAQPVRAIFREHGVNPPLIAKIEREEALNSIDEVLTQFDGVMVARGDLAVDLRPERVPTAQKRIIRSAVAVGKPVITATQMLESMTYNSLPTRAEASDVANAVYDGTDAVMLSGESAIGAYPVEAVRTMDRIVREAESQWPGLEAPKVLPSSTLAAFCAAAVRLAVDTDSAALAALTRNGETARALSAMRPHMPIVALCEDDLVAHALNMCHAIVPLHIARQSGIEFASDVIRREIAAQKLLPVGSQVVVVGVTPNSESGRTDFIRLITI